MSVYRVKNTDVSGFQMVEKRVSYEMVWIWNGLDYFGSHLIITIEKSDILIRFSNGRVIARA